MTDESSRGAAIRQLIAKCAYALRHIHEGSNGMRVQVDDKGTSWIYARDLADECDAALSQLLEHAPQPSRPHFRCSECGPVGVDEDGCCRQCGSDTTIVAGEHAPQPQQEQGDMSPGSPAIPVSADPPSTSDEDVYLAAFHELNAPGEMMNRQERKDWWSVTCELLWAFDHHRGIDHDECDTCRRVLENWIILRALPRLRQIAPDGSSQSNAIRPFPRPKPAGEHAQSPQPSSTSKE